MGIYIKRMEMPENCIECPLRKSTVCDAFQLIQPYTFEDDERAAFCPMTEVSEPKTGKWVKVIDSDTLTEVTWHYECDQCGAGRWENGQRYCSNCGADMRGEEG